MSLATPLFGLLPDRPGVGPGRVLRGRCTCWRGLISVGQLDERLQHALDTLEASVDIEPGGLEWEPADRQMTLGVEPGPGEVRWGDPRRSRRDGGPFGQRRPPGASPPIGRRRPGPRTPRTATAFGGPRLATRGEASATRGPAETRPRAPGRRARLRGAVPGSLVLVVGLPPAPRGGDAGPARVWPCPGMSLSVWTVSLATGRWLCRRALTPMIRIRGPRPR